MSPRRLLRRFHGDLGGATALEFALVLPVFVLLVLGAISASTLGLSVASMNYAVEEAARCSALKKDACLTPSATATFASTKYVGPSVSPVFTYSTAGCGNTVTGTATFSLNLVSAFRSVPLSTSACYPSA